MANLLTDISLTSAHSFTGTFGDIAGMSDSVTVAGPGSVVILMMSLTPAQDPSGDACMDFRFTEGGSQVGAIVSGFADNSSTQTNGVTMMFALTGLSAGSHTFAVQGRDRQGDGRVDTDDVRTLQIVEIESGASLLVDLLTTVANDAPASWANMTNLSDTQTPGAGSVLIWNMTVQMLDSGAADKAAEYRFAVDGTRIGPHLSDRNDQANKVDGVSMAWAADGVPASSHTFSVQWQELLSTPDMDTARERIFQVIEISADADLLIDVSSTSSQGATGSYSDQLPMGGQPDIDSIDSIPLVLWNWNMDASASSDAVAKVRLEIAGTQEGAQLPISRMAWIKYPAVSWCAPYRAKVASPILSASG